MASGNRSSVRSSLSCPSAWPFTAVGSATIVHLPASPSPVPHNVKSGSRFADSVDKSTITGPLPCASAASATPNARKRGSHSGRDSSSDRSRQIEDDAGHRTGQKRLDHAGLEPEDCDHRGGRQKQRPGIDARNRRHIKGQTEAAEMSDLVKPGVQGKPDSQIEDHTNDGSGDARERAVQGLVVPQPLDKRRTKPIHKKHGTNVHQVASSPPRVPATIGGSEPGCRNAARKPTNWTTMISGPGVVSAMPSPSSISPGRNHP